MLHVLNGHATLEKLAPSGVPGDFTVWADVLHEGPVPDVEASELRRIRAGHLADGYREPESRVLADLEQWDAALENYRAHEEVVFWYEHDLFDQLLLIRHMDWLSRIDRGATRFSMVPGDDYLGPQSPAQLAALFAQRTPVTAAQITGGAHAWHLFRAPDPAPMVAWSASGQAAALPFLADALHRFFEEFPSTRDGLGRTERQVLEAVATGHHLFADAFRASQAREARVFMGDLTFWLIARRLASGPSPLLALSPNATEPAPGARLDLTDAGRDVLEGRADHIALNGIDRWFGGTHLTADRHWRWDGSRFRS